jgi:hypothetical protein
MTVAHAAGANQVMNPSSSGTPIQTNAIVSVKTLHIFIVFFLLCLPS